MLALWQTLLLPFMCIAVWSVLAAHRQWTVLAFSVVMCAATLGTGFWAILQSRSSTAGIGVLFLPALGSLSAMAAAAFSAGRVSARPIVRAGAWLALMASVAVPAAAVRGGIQTRAKNARADQAQAENERAISANRARIAALLLAHPGDEDAALAADIAAHRGDRTVLIPALETAFVPEDTLDGLSRDPDLGIVLMVARNPRTRPQTLERIYRAAPYPGYFLQALAANPHTPVPVLRELAGRSRENTGIAPSLARNPSTPQDVLDAIRSGR